MGQPGPQIKICGVPTMASFVNINAERQRQRSSLYIEVAPQYISDKYVSRLLSQKVLSTLWIAMSEPGALGQDRPYAEGTPGYDRLFGILMDQGELTKLDSLQIDGNRMGRNIREDKRTRMVSNELVEAIASRHLSVLTFVSVDFEEPTLYNLMRSARVDHIYFCDVRFIAGCHGPESLTLPLSLKSIKVHSVPPEMLRFLGSAITIRHRIHLILSASEDNMIQETFWAAIDAVLQFGDYQGKGVWKLTLDGHPRFTEECSIWRDLPKYVNLGEVNIKNATFVGSAYADFIKYVSNKASPLRKLELKGWNLVGKHIGDELGEFLGALENGPVVWYAHTNVSCKIATRIAGRIHNMNLEAVHLEIVGNRRRGSKFPAAELVEAVRASGSLGVFNSEERAAVASEMGVQGLSAIGVKSNDCDVQSAGHFFDIFTDDQMDLLDNFFERNRRESARNT